MRFNRRKRKKCNYNFDQKDINSVLYSLPNIVDVIGEFIILRKKKNISVGRCPFCRELTHNDSHFIVSNKGYKCFYCGIGGVNLFSFFMIYYDKPFDSILIWLNNRYTKKKIECKESKYLLNKYKADDYPF
jgi:DNA primase